MNCFGRGWSAACWSASDSDLILSPDIRNVVPAATVLMKRRLEGFSFIFLSTAIAPE
jgi:hypothetical protein